MDGELFSPERQRNQRQALRSGDFLIGPNYQSTDAIQHTIRFVKNLSAGLSSKGFFGFAFYKSSSNILE